ncbi:MAG: hypothetical protein Q8K72_14845, partial [Acidimicrobiales bacterium]|nr:hypothetical protein [Acidimicrobiales bacterium]
AMEARGLESPYKEWLENWSDRADPGLRVTTRVRCDDWFHLRDQALIAHATQIDPTSRWFLVPPDIQRDVWPTEDYELVKSTVDSPTPEDDLFAGVAAEVAVRRAG